MADDFFRDVVATFSPERQNKIEERSKQLQVQNKLALRNEEVNRKHLISLLISPQPIRSKSSKPVLILAHRSQGFVNLNTLARRPKHLVNGQLSSVS